jgi:transposase-like protein
MKYPTTLVEAVRYFSNPDICIEHVAALRWPTGVVCPTCGRVDASYLEKEKRWQCKSRHAHRQFSVKIGTIFEDSPLGLDKWLPAVWMIVNAKNGVSSYEIARALGVTQKTAWFMDHRIRAAMEYGTFDKGKLDSPVEADETYVDGKAREQDGRFSNKTAIVGVVEKKKHVGQIKAFATKQADATNTMPFLNANLEVGTTLRTDESKIYSRANRTFIHESVNHSEKEYARGAVSTTTIDGFWNLFKRSYKGTYTHLAPDHLDRYVKEHTYRYNTRMLNDGERFTQWFSGCNQRLTYKSLIRKPI